MTTIRAVFRLIVFSVFLGIWYLTYLGVRNVLGFFGKDVTRWRNRCMHFWGKAVCRIVGMKITVKGRLPDPPFFLVSNHLSYLDIIPFYRHIDCVFVAKREVESWPVFGHMTRNLDNIFVDRENPRDVVRVNKRIQTSITSGQGVVLFPEGTSTGGMDIRPFKTPLLKFASDEGFPVSHAVISYRSHDPRRPAHTHICWWGEMDFSSHFFNFLKIRSSEAVVRFGDTDIREKDRKLLAEKLFASMKDDFTPTMSVYEHTE